MEVFSCCASFVAPNSLGPEEEVVECLAMIGTDVSQHVPKGVNSVPKDIVFDRVCVIGKLDKNQEELCLSIPSKKGIVFWPTITDTKDMFSLREYLDVKVRALVLEVLGEE